MKNIELCNKTSHYIFLQIITFGGVKVIYVESICRVETLSLSAKLLYYLADHLLVQWPSLQAKYPRTQYIGRLVWSRGFGSNVTRLHKAPKTNMYVPSHNKSIPGTADYAIMIPSNIQASAVMIWSSFKFTKWWLNHKLHFCFQLRVCEIGSSV